MKNLVSAFLVSLIFVSGCVTGADGKKQLHWAAAFTIERAVERGTRAYLRQKPEDTMKFQHAKTAIQAFMVRTNFTGEDLGRILKTLPIDAFKGPEGALYVSDVAVVYDFLKEVATRVDKKEMLLPAAASIVAGLDRAIPLSHLQGPPPPPAFPTLISPIRTNELVAAHKANAKPLARSAGFTPAAAGPPTTNHLVWSPYMTNGLNGLVVFRAHALKKFDKGIRIIAQYQGITGPDWFVNPLVVPCYPEEQEWIFEGRGTFATGFFRLEEDDCPTGFSVASAEHKLGNAFVMNTPSGPKLVAEGFGVTNGSVTLRAFKVIK